MGPISNNKYAHLRMTMSLRYLEVQVDELVTRGFSREDCLAALDLTEDDFLKPKSRIDVIRAERMFSAAAKALSEPRIAMNIGYKFRVHDFAKTGSIYTFCDTLPHVFEMIRRYQRLTIDIAEPGYHVEGGRHFFTFDPYPEVQEMHHVMSLILGSYATAFRWMSWASGHELLEVTLMPRAPKDIQTYEEAMNCPVRFGAPRNHGEFHADAIKKSLLTRNPEKLAQAVDLLDGILDRGDKTENFKSITTTSIRSAMNRGSVSLPIVASRMNISERKLRQKLREQGLSFRGLLEDERKAVFQKLHGRGEAFAAISQALAYNDQAAFNKAFKRWYGIPPSQYKAEMD